jgi:esterase/lipase superfamily enzyme
MIAVSCRENFSSTTKFRKNLVSNGEYPTNKRVLVLVHGFNADMDKVWKRYHEIDDQVHESGAFDEVVGFFWPGSWTRVLGYMKTDARAPMAGTHLAELIFRLVDRGNTVTVEAHSLGCKVALHASVFLKQGEVDRFIFFAPAVKNNILKEFPRFLTCAQKSPRIYYSKDDGVLKYAFRMVPYNWSTPAMGYSGPEPQLNYGVNHFSPITFDMTGIVDDHSGYMKDVIKLCS